MLEKTGNHNTVLSHLNLYVTKLLSEDSADPIPQALGNLAFMCILRYKHNQKTISTLFRLLSTYVPILISKNQSSLLDGL